MITLDHVGECAGQALHVVEVYSAENGMAHGSLDAAVSVCTDHVEATTSQVHKAGLTSYVVKEGANGGTCGDRITFRVNAYTSPDSTDGATRSSDPTD